MLALAARPAEAQLVSGLRWRNVGPFRAGRVSAVTGAIGEPGVFYAGFPTGGVWKTTNAGTTWDPIFDAVTSVSAIGAIEVAGSDTSVIYAGTGDMPTGGNINEGDGVYKSADAGRTWRHLGLDSAKQIPSILVDPKDANLVLVAAQGDLHAAGGERGVYRSTDGGRTWTRTLFVDDSTGIQKLAWAYDQPGVVFATTDRHYFAPQANARFGFGGAGRPRTHGHGHLQVHGRRAHLAGGQGHRPAPALRPHVHRRGDAHQLPARVPDRQLRPVSLGRRRHLLAPHGLDRRARRQRPGRIQLRRVRQQQQPRRRLHDQHVELHLDRRRQHLHRLQGRAGRRRPAAAVDRSHRRPADAARDGPGRDGDPRRRPHLEPVVQPVHGAGLPHLGRPLVPVLDLRQPAGRGRHPHAEPRQLRRDHADGLEPGRRLGVGHRSSRTRSTRTSSTARARASSRSPGRASRSSTSARASTRSRTCGRRNSSRSSGRRGTQHELLVGLQYVMATTDGGAHWRKLSPDLGYPKGVTPPRREPGRGVPAEAAVRRRGRRDRVHVRLDACAAASSGWARTTA